MTDQELVKKHYSKVQKMRLLDDEFMSVVFKNYPNAIQKCLRIVMKDPKLKVLTVNVQETKQSLVGRSVRLDVQVKDRTGRIFDVEVQRSDKGAAPKRARYNLGMLDSGNLGVGEDFDKLPATYVIFITEHDVIGKGLPMYHVERVILETKELFEDAEHIIFVNAAYNGTDDIGKLMADFRTSDPKKVNYQELAQPMRYYKTDEGGVKQMCRIIEQERREAADFKELTLLQNLMEVQGISLEDAMKSLKIPLEKLEEYKELIKQ